MPDLGHQLTEEELKKLEKKIAKEYRTAVAEMKEKLADYAKKYDAAWKKVIAQLETGEITQEEYTSWIKRHLNGDKKLKEMISDLSQDMHQANVIAHKTATGGMADIYALNGNYATYMIEHGGKIDTGFTLYNHDSAAALLKEKKQLMPGPSTKKAAQIAANKDMQWNYNKIQSAVLQSVLQGESPYNLADRLEGIAKMNRNASVRYARTMTTSVQNMGRYDAFERAKGLGVDLMAEWNAILDNRTRHEHRMMHGQRKPVGEPFKVDGFEIMYPGQSDGPGASDIPQQLIWNCRCTIIAWVKGFEGKVVKENPDMGGMSFEEWQEANAPKPKEEPEPSRWEAPKTMSDEEYTEWQKQNSSAKQYESAFEKQYGMTIKEADNSYDDDPVTGKQMWELAREANATLSAPYGSYRAGYVANADGSRAINKYLRTGDVGMYTKKEMKETIDAMNKLIDATTINQDMAADRWIHAGVLDKLGVDTGSHGKPFRIGHAFCTDGLNYNQITKNIKENLVGRTITDNGFMSASASSDLNVFRGSDVKFTLNVPKGTHAFITNNTRESEIVFPPGLKQQVRDVRIIETEAFDHDHNPFKRTSIEILLDIIG